MTPKFNNPVTKKEDIKELQERLVQLCIDFIDERNLTDINEVSFHVDGLCNNAQEFHEWVPQMDSHIAIYGLQETGKTYTSLKGNTFKIHKRALIGEYC